MANSFKKQYFSSSQPQANPDPGVEVKPDAEATADKGEFAETAKLKGVKGVKSLRAGGGMGVGT